MSPIHNSFLFFLWFMWMTTSWLLQFEQCVFNFCIYKDLLHSLVIVLAILFPFASLWERSVQGLHLHAIFYLYSWHQHCFWWTIFSNKTLLGKWRYEVGKLWLQLFHEKGWQSNLSEFVCLYTSESTYVSTILTPPFNPFLNAPFPLPPASTWAFSTISFTFRLLAISWASAFVFATPNFGTGIPASFKSV